MEDPNLNTLKFNLTREEKKIKFTISSFFIHLIMILLACSVIIPLILPFLFVFKTELEFAQSPWSFPTHFGINNFRTAWESLHLAQGMSNTFILCLGAILITVPAAAMAGYIFARYRTKTTNFLFYIIMSGFFIPVHMVLIPLYKVNSNLQLINTFPGVFLPIAAFGVPFWTMIYRSFFASLPGELIEASRIDGAGQWRTFLQIILPNTKSATVLAVMLVFMGAWSDYLMSLIFINKQELFTLQLRVAQFIGSLGGNFFPQYAAGVIISAAPTVILYALFHKYIIEGTTMAGALKG
jgi:ABC-type glycerol-3-phosphate transport system permease component